MRKAFAFALLVLAACGGDKGGGTETVRVATVAISPLNGGLYVGDSVRLSTTIRDASGTVLSGRPVTWESSNSAVASVTDGRLKGVSPGTSTITATSEGKRGQLDVTVTLVPIASVSLSRGALTLQVGASEQLTATVLDDRNNPVTDFPAARPLVWRSSDDAKVSIAGTGLTITVTGVAAGAASIRAEVGGRSAEAQVTATTATAPQIAAISPALLTPGSTATITGSGFAEAAVSNLVTVDGVAAVVTAATPSQLTVTVPTAGQLGCVATHDATVEVTAGGLSASRAHPVQVAPQRTLSPGQALVFLDPIEARCNEFSQTGGAYVVSVFNTRTTLSASTAFQLRGAASTALNGAPVAATAAPSAHLAAMGGAGPSAPSRELDAEWRRARQAAATHHRLLESSRALFRAGAGARRAARGGNPASLQRASRLSARAVGDTLTLSFPNVKRSDFCTAAPFKVKARVAYAGTHAIILEDSLNLLYGQMDSYFQQLGQEFDDVMYPIITQHFGSPIAYDAALDNNGRILMLFSKRVNDVGGVLGFVTACDFFDPAVDYPDGTGGTVRALASNKAEIFYAIAPTSTGSGPAFDITSVTRDAWRRMIRGTTIHEVKHITSLAERFADPRLAELEESWLEEGTAMHAEELYSRTITGAVWKGNTPYGSAATLNHLYCEVLVNGAYRTGCPTDRPRVMLDAFVWLAEYEKDVENRSMFGSSASGDASFYGSSWMFVRWVIDQYSSDATFLKGLISAAPLETGITNLTNRAGRSFAELLGDYSLALAVDDYPAFVPSRPQLAIPSWNTRDIFAGLARDVPFVGPNPFPLRMRGAQYGQFVWDISALRAGSAAYFELSGVQSGRQLLELRSAGGAPADAALGLASVRVK